MGYIDKVTATVRCPECSAEETAVALEKGSQYGASWGSFGEFKLFQVTIAADQFGPEVKSATCKVCKVPAEVTNATGP